MLRKTGRFLRSCFGTYQRLMRKRISAYAGAWAKPRNNRAMCLSGGRATKRKADGGLSDDGGGRFSTTEAGKTAGRENITDTQCLI